MFGFKKRKQLFEHRLAELRRQKDHDFWMNELQYLWFKDRAKNVLQFMDVILNVVK